MDPDFLHPLNDEPFDPLDPFRGRKHRHPAHILTAAPFGGHRDFDLFSRNNLCVYDRRRIVSGIGPSEGMTHRFPKISIPISLADPLEDGLFEASSHEMDVLPQFDKNHGNTRILAHGHLFFPCDPGILLEFLQNLNCPQETPP